jgi:hypothetical protein
MKRRGRRKDTEQRGEKTYQVGGHDSSRLHGLTAAKSKVRVKAKNKVKTAPG